VHEDVEQVLLSEIEILRGIERVAAEVTEVFRGTPLTAVSILKGSCIFAADLVRRLPIPLDLAFAATRSYGDATTAGRLEIELMPSRDEVLGREVLLIDDILDTGQTLTAVRRELLDLGAAGVRTCVFLDKPARRTVSCHADFRCFEIDDVFVVGYGLDHAGRYRNLPFVGALRPELLEAATQAE
jgi:hypoxanthine phosphoribosyltransferase